MLTQQSTVHGKYHGKTGYLLGNVDVGIWEFVGMGYCVNNMQTMQNQVAVDDIMMPTVCTEVLQVPLHIS